MDETRWFESSDEGKAQLRDMKNSEQREVLLATFTL